MSIFKSPHKLTVDFQTIEKGVSRIEFYVDGYPVIDEGSKKPFVLVLSSEELPLGKLDCARISVEWPSEIKMTADSALETLKNLSECACETLRGQTA